MEQTRARVGREEAGTRERHSRRRSSGRVEIGGKALSEGGGEVGLGGWGWGWEGWVLERQDLTSHERDLELQLCSVETMASDRGQEVEDDV